MLQSSGNRLRRLIALGCVLVFLCPAIRIGVSACVGGQHTAMSAHQCSSECTPETCPMRRHQQEHKSAPYDIGECHHDTQLASTLLLPMPSLQPVRIDTTPALESDSMKRDADMTASDHIESPPPLPPWA